MRHIEVSSDIGDNLTSRIFSDKNNSVFVRQELNISYNNNTYMNHMRAWICTMADNNNNKMILSTFVISFEMSLNTMIIDEFKKYFFNMNVFVSI